MPATFSINVGQIIEATRKPDIFTVLKDLQDNTQKLISPRDVRDAFLSVWANSSIKITTPGNNSTSEYIGVDSGNPSDRDIKKKILLGKRSVGNLDIMNSSLLSSDTDIFFYNTKLDTITQSSTKISFLSGTNSVLFSNAPYIEALTTTSSTVDFNINNPSVNGGPISIYSNSGRVSINGILFPTISESAGSASNGKILRYTGTFPNGYLRWDESITSLTNIGTPGLTTSIYGDPVLVNGYPIEFWDNGQIPVTIGGITQGSTFPQDSFTAGGFTTPGSGQNWPIVEVIRKMLYPYIKPTLQLSIFNTTTGTTYAEVGSLATFSITYSITTFARKSDEFISDYYIRSTSGFSPLFFVGPTISYGSSFSSKPGSLTSSSILYSTQSSVVSTKNFTLYTSTRNDLNISILQSGAPFGYSFSSTKTVSFINPVFAGFSNTLVNNTTLLSTFFSNANKMIVPYPGLSNSISISATGSGYFYFVYPTTFTTNVRIIKDPNGFVIHNSTAISNSAFAASYSIASPSPYTGTYRVFRTNLVCSFTESGNFEFIF
jgi:hypothetical protein